MLRLKTYSYLIDDGNSDNKTKGANKKKKKCVIKRILKFNKYKNCLLNNKIVLKSQQRFNRKSHNVYTEKINKTALSSNADKRLQTFDRITFRIGLHIGYIYIYIYIYMVQMLEKYTKQSC